ncbi:hypothetical protein A2U01_0101515, partial [Trifolium medium]|nr:hypothetical protein [Trifolium medium]
VVAKKIEFAADGKKDKKEDKKRKASGIRIVEGRSKLKHDKRSKEDESGTESDDVPLSQKLKQRTSEDYTKEMTK